MQFEQVLFHRKIKLKFDLKKCQWMQGFQMSFLGRQIWQEGTHDTLKLRKSPKSKELFSSGPNLFGPLP